MNPSRCAACKHLRMRCPSDCIFSPYFPSNNPTRFTFVHQIYGPSNVAKFLQDLPVSYRAEAADSLWYEAAYIIRDPVYGCVGVISILQQQIQDLECQLARTRAQIASLLARDHSQVQGLGGLCDYQFQQYLGDSNLPDLSTWLD